jgi:hypothetical protein
MSRAKRIAIILTLVLATTTGLLTPRAWAWWSDNARGTATLTAFTVPAPTGITCTLHTQRSVLGVATGYYDGVRVNATLPAAATAPAGMTYSYDVSFARMATPNTVIWSTAAGTSAGTLTISGTSLQYTFSNNDISKDQSASLNPGIDYYLTVTVRLGTTSWTAQQRINIDASNYAGTLGILGAGFYYGSTTGSTSPGGQPGRCGTEG